ncbi:hypothetical protein H7F51_01000 [Novosphingobium flavum]|uniref:Uncharacterized protein n=1 Tax=Novosphingobium flavum TaxID=1778672 RepID=A0A7X1FNR9_9SPHN|nr:hypothetical protein [Novosphingobium flavum]MBC2664088.1 hypothetical protein [Novosphingobium flavum]
MRPQSIIYFERIIFGTLILGVIQNFFGWNRAIDLVATTQSNPVFFIVFVQIFTYLLIGTLTLLVSRRRSKVAMWISITMFVIGIPVLFKIVASGLLFGSGAITALQTIGQLIAFALLFTSSSRHWMSGEAQSVEVFQ